VELRHANKVFVSNKGFQDFREHSPVERGEEKLGTWSWEKIISTIPVPSRTVPSGVPSACFPL